MSSIVIAKGKKKKAGGGYRGKGGKRIERGEKREKRVIAVFSQLPLPITC